MLKYQPYFHALLYNLVSGKSLILKRLGVCLAIIKERWLDCYLCPRSAGRRVCSFVVLWFITSFDPKIDLVSEGTSFAI